MNKLFITYWKTKSKKHVQNIVSDLKELWRRLEYRFNRPELAARAFLSEFYQIRAKELLLFIGVQEEDVKRPEWDIEMLTGLEYLGSNPEKGKSNSLLLGKKFITCLERTHVLLQYNTQVIFKFPS